MSEVKKLSHLPKIDTRKLRAPPPPRSQAPCAREMTAFLNCIQGDAQDTVRCKDVELALGECVQALRASRVAQSNHKSTLTFHLHRFARQLGYKI